MAGLRMNSSETDFFYIDTHAHLDMIRQMTPDMAVKESLRENVRYIINVGSSISGSKKSSEYSKQFENVFATVGIHPHYVRNFDKEKILILENLIKENGKIVAIGEAGLDYFRNLSPKEDQRRAFEMHIKLAQKYKLPLVVHDRDAHEDTLEVLKHYYSNSTGGVVIHCFSGDTAFALKCLEEGFFISFTGVITFPNAKSILQTIKEVPMERIFIETDSPFLAPQEKRGKENFPGFVPYVAKKISEIKGIPIGEVAFVSSRNAIDFFKLSIDNR
jgi:TatD DNase family protein